MSNEWKCPKCGIGAMRQQGMMSCNCRCEVCGNNIYVPRPEMPKADLSGARKTVSDMSSRSAKQLSRGAIDAARAANRHREDARRLGREADMAKEKAEILTKHAKRSEAILKKYGHDSKRYNEERAKALRERDEALRKHEKKWSKKGSGFFAYLVVAVIFVFILKYLGLI